MSDSDEIIAELIRATPRAFAAGVVERQLDERPDAVVALAQGSQPELIRDTELRLRYLAEAIAFDRPALFHDHVAWMRAAIESRRVDGQLLLDHLSCMRAELVASLPAGGGELAARVVDDAVRRLREEPYGSQTLLLDDAPHGDLARRYLLAVLEGRSRDAVELVLGAADSGVPLRDLLVDVLQTAQMELGHMWQSGEIHTSEEHLASRTTERCVELLRQRVPRAAASGDPPRRMLAGSAAGETHDLAQRFLAAHCELGGWEVLLLGANSPAVDVVRAAADYSVDVVALSVSIALHLGNTRAVIGALRATPEVADVGVLVGGRPFGVVPDLWQLVGADGSATTLDEAGAAADAIVARRRAGG